MPKILKMNKPVILIGYGGHGIVAAEILLEAKNSIAGYCDKEEKINPFSISYKGGERGFFLDTNNCKMFSAFIGVGNAILRQEIFNFLQKQEVDIINAIHPQSIVSKTATIGYGVFLAAGAVVNPMCTLGNGVIVNTSSSIDHDCTIGDFSHICPGAVLCGNVTIGKHSFIGANSTIIPGKKIGDHIIVGAGSTVINDLVVPGIYAGSPARILPK